MTVLRGAAFVCGDDQPIPSGTAIVIVLADADRRAHPLDGVLTQPVAMTFAVIFLLSEIVGITVSAIAVISAGKRDLVKWTPTLHLYSPLAALAAYKGIFELAAKPFYWDKTSHEIFTATGAIDPEPEKVSATPQPLLRPIAAEL